MNEDITPRKSDVINSISSNEEKPINPRNSIGRTYDLRKSIDNNNN